MYISRIRLENIRGFRELAIDLSGARSRKRTLIIGKNGTCKTSVLRAIALGLCDVSDAATLITEPIGEMTHRGVSKGVIEIVLEGGGILKTSTLSGRDTGKEHIVKEKPSEGGWPQTFVCGYGAGRYGGRPDTGREYRGVDGVYTLFDYQRALIDPELTLRRLRDFLGTGKYEVVLTGIKRALGLVMEDDIHLPRGGGIGVLRPLYRWGHPPGGLGGRL